MGALIETPSGNTRFFFIRVFHKGLSGQSSVEVDGFERILIHGCSSNALIPEIGFQVEFICTHVAWVAVRAAVYKRREHKMLFFLNGG